MAAVYPTAIKSFSYRQDFTQIVNAADVNVAYDEITAVQNVLGTKPNSDSPDGTVINFSSVKENIASARRGDQNPSCFARVVNFLVAKGGDNPGSRTFPNFTDTVWDTHGMWKGGDSLICPRSGIYSFNLYTEWQKNSDPYDFEQTPFQRSNYVQMGLQFYKSGRFITGQNHQVVQGAQYAPRLAASTSWQWTKGVPLNVNLLQTIFDAPMLVNVYLNVTYERSLAS